MNSPIVVLGARVIGGRPSPMLEARLSSALTLWSAEPSRDIVVSGHRGEAAVMAAWLAQRGVASVVEEPLARSTNENLENSAALYPGVRLTVVTSSFHVPRTRAWAWHLGIPVEVVSAPTPRRSRAKNYAREVIALPHSVARVVWRRLLASASTRKPKNGPG
ncbi:YdcF family protein [Corynebacterium liangguodongii]|uniref:YdcF family protein n=1 Tax=Corynebacterium liangguodongii TaxID=2079535 RepID=A0A2S0WCM4_9CORY|nr:YdcF family protein [Corynebacterium liangguodongii]AWB83527.1 YdcF family protein [Corynebacterium liangguodongii]PWC00383.1 YdcF family protein [Corynebacterium liangguodongii]